MISVHLKKGVNIMTTNYENMKNHFDKLIKGGYPTSHGLESIRSVYEDAFNKKINLYDVYQTNLKVSTNPVGGLITLIGPYNDNLPEGFIMNEDGKVYYVKQFTNDIMKDIDKDALKKYKSTTNSCGGFNINNLQHTPQRIYLFYKYF